MSGRGKGGKVKGKAKSRSSRAGLQFPVGRIHRLLRKGNYAERVGAGAPVYLAAVLLAIRNDEELKKLLSGCDHRTGWCFAQHPGRAPSQEDPEASRQDDLKFQNQPEQFLQGKFLEFCRKLTVYGSAFFTGSLQPNSKSSILCHIGVNDVGIHIINMKSKVMLYSFLYSDIRWSHPEAQPSFLEIYTVNDNSDPRQVKIKSRQAGLIEHLMQKLKDLHQYDDRQVNLVFGTSGRR
uniref:Histone H2A n=1 Tax=Magallana gigas TaxID=29159 RepID=A0A8W8L0W9_MAGGI